MIRLFNVYYPTRKIVLFSGELLIVCSSFVAAIVIRLGQDSILMLKYEHGIYKILGITLLALVCLDALDLYDLDRIPSRTETYFRLLAVMGVLSFLLAGLEYLFPRLLPGNNTLVVGLSILTLALLVWRSLHTWLLRLPLLRERIYVLGEGERASRLVRALRSRPELGMDVAGWSRETGGGPSRCEALGSHLVESVTSAQVDHVIVALNDRRGVLPVRELLDLRLRGIKVEEATGLLERISGKIEVDGLYPSWLVFAQGFRLKPEHLIFQRIFGFVASLACLLVFLPLFPLIALAVKLSSPGPIFYRQRRVGHGGRLFFCYKFRSMRQDAEATSGAIWAGDNDPRITSVGKWLRHTRLDELPQLWNVLRGDMGFVGPRPERPEFVTWLTREIPYYQLRHIIRPGITGWAQVCYSYSGSLEESREKLKYDLYYIKNISLSLDLVIILRSIKIVLLGRGAR
jgi:sugar transferase (PEP-CTERM system associated)